MSFVDAVKSVFSKYATFSGRARRSELWYFCLFNIIVSIVLGAVGNLTGLKFISSVYSLAVIIPGLAVVARRLHDIGKSAWWMLISLVPIVGSILLLIWECKDSEPGENQYGPNPKEAPEV